MDPARGAPAEFEVLDEEELVDDDADEEDRVFDGCIGSPPPSSLTLPYGSFDFWFSIGKLDDVFVPAIGVAGDDMAGDLIAELDILSP